MGGAGCDARGGTGGGVFAWVSVEPRAAVCAGRAAGEKPRWRGDDTAKLTSAEKGPKKAERGRIGVDLAHFVTFFRRDFSQNFADDKRVKFTLHQIRGCFFVFCENRGF